MGSHYTKCPNFQSRAEVKAKYSRSPFIMRNSKGKMLLMIHHRETKARTVSIYHPLTVPEKLNAREIGILLQ